MNDKIADAIRSARAIEKVALSEAQKRAQKQIKEDTATEHEAIIEAIRHAVNAGMSAKAIGKAYGSSDPNTVKRLITESTLGTTPDTSSAHPQWKLTRNTDDTFNITAYSLGDAKLSGFGRFRVDEDNENFSLVEGDPFIQLQLYKLGYKDTVIKEATK